MNKKQQIQEKPEKKAKFAFGKENYRIMYIGINCLRPIANDWWRI